MERVRPLNHLVCNRTNLSGKGPACLEYIKKKDLQLMLLAGSSPNSPGTGPARLESASSFGKQ